MTIRFPFKKGWRVDIITWIGWIVFFLIYKCILYFPRRKNRTCFSYTVYIYIYYYLYIYIFICLKIPQQGHTDTKAYWNILSIQKKTTNFQPSGRFNLQNFQRSRQPSLWGLVILIQKRSSRWLVDVPQKPRLIGQPLTHPTNNTPPEMRRPFVSLLVNHRVSINKALVIPCSVIPCLLRGE